MNRVELQDIKLTHRNPFHSYTLIMSDVEHFFMFCFVFVSFALGDTLKVKKEILL